ncbi:AbrB/MazE/SpoVT family DNA-binding domain-containing protein [Clostridium butyricum]|uniref:AbrB/MazE/SpoVT family DNA-binding domain-containing protein n=1 Tax=Clostridium butyricum TaxID=1492 RepID=UPI001CA9C555|nr:AbrB/MazE/SpoVT family DNA-binding domain-containing protein [Clostridium butyricum]MBZ0312438.1 AbrB/MazE/SpoVT family DNA-binding domain-containing protein [Clostridium butyricum]
MQAKGIVRNLDCLGRVVIPKEIRKKLDINEGEPVAIIDEVNQIIIRKYRRGCVFCGSEEQLVEHKEMCVCRKCVLALKK